MSAHRNPANIKRDRKILKLHQAGKRPIEIARSMQISRHAVAGVLDRNNRTHHHTNVPPEQVEQIIHMRDTGSGWEVIAQRMGWSMSTCRRIYSKFRKDPHTGRAFGDHGTAHQAIDFALTTPAGFECANFLAAWRSGDLKSWPEFYAWLNKQ